ncbi:hypothetical protein M3J09_008409 [Ascochyta lentis]
MYLQFLHYFFAAAALFGFACAHATLWEGVVHADSHDAASLGAEPGFGSEPVFQGNEGGAFIEALLQEKNETGPSLLRDRSADLYSKRQSCQSGYGYCASLGGCCPSHNRCCSYGYCLEPGKTCCPNGPCAAGSSCCGNNNCHPEGTQCCQNGRYCEVGNICVIYNGQSGCCTDLKCTAVVRSGTTSFATTTTTTVVAPPPTITQPPRTTEVLVDVYATYYWTVTWRYFSYYWYVFDAQSTVTYTTITVTTIYTTTATDDRDASSLFVQLSRTLVFSTPADATTLASLVGAVPSATATPTPAQETEDSSTSRAIEIPTSPDSSPVPSVARTSTSRAPSSRATTSSSAPASFTGGGSTASGIAVQTPLMVLAALSGVLMILL